MRIRLPSLGVFTDFDQFVGLLDDCGAKRFVLLLELRQIFPSAECGPLSEFAFSEAAVVTRSPSCNTGSDAQLVEIWILALTIEVVMRLMFATGRASFDVF